MQGAEIGGYLKGDTVDGGWWTLRVSLAPSRDVSLPRSVRDTIGYYTTDDGWGDTMKPIVARLSHGRVLAGWTMGEGMSTAVDVSHVFTDERDAWLSAHDMTERDAETERDYQASRCHECYDGTRRGEGELPDLCESCYAESGGRTLAHHACD